jgi:carotenoid 1,2-hydratase
MNLLSGVEQDFHHPPKSPGAYEWWHFDGTDDNNGLSFSAQFYSGHLLSPYYQEKLAAYWKDSRSPLVSDSKSAPPNPPPVSPPAFSAPNGPNPLDYNGVIFRLFHKGDLAGEFLQEFASGMLKASDQQPAVLMGSNRFNWDPDGNPPSYGLTLQGAVKGGRQSIRARFFFTPEKFSMPSHPSSETFPTHTWILAAPRCRVEGTVQWCNAEGEVKKEAAFVGKGYHDHHFGSVPPVQFIKSWHWGRVFMGEETLVYSLQIPMDEKDAPYGLLLNGDKAEFQVWEVAFKLSKNRRNFFWLPYQKNLEFTDSQSLRIGHRQILSDGPVALTFEDEVQWTANGKILKNLGLSYYLYTPRLSSPFFFPMLKGKTTIFIQSPGDLPANLPPDPGDVSTTRPA